MSESQSGAIDTDSVAADLADLIYERLMAAAAAGEMLEHAALEALCVLGDCLRNYADDPKGSEATMRMAVQELAQLPGCPQMGEFQQRLLSAMRRHKNR